MGLKLLFYGSCKSFLVKEISVDVFVSADYFQRRAAKIFSFSRLPSVVKLVFSSIFSENKPLRNGWKCLVIREEFIFLIEHSMLFG